MEDLEACFDVDVIGGTRAAKKGWTGFVGFAEVSSEEALESSFLFFDIVSIEGSGSTAVGFTGESSMTITSRAG